MRAAWRRFRKDRRANVAVIFALALVPTLGVFGLGSEGSYWLLTQRAEQNAADAAVMAAAQAGQADVNYSRAQGSPSNPNSYVNEGLGVASNYGFTSAGASTGLTYVNVAVSNSAACPANSKLVNLNPNGSATCYEVTVTKNVPLYFTPLVGFHGSGTASGGIHYQTISATAYAGPVSAPASVCLLTAAEGGLGQGNGAKASEGGIFNGNGNTNLVGCNVGSLTNLSCQGHNLNAPEGIANDTNGGSAGCGNDQISDASPPLTNPYAGNTPAVPADPCGGNYVQESSSSVKTLTGSFTSSTLVSAGGLISVTGGGAACGDLKLTGNVTLTSGNAILLIENGTLDLNGFSITTSGSAGLTVVFAGSGTGNGISSTPQQYVSVTNGSASTINIAAPTSGTWQGYSIFQDPSTINASNAWVKSETNGNKQNYITYNGTSPSWDLTGIVYMPYADFTLNGAIGKSSSGYECFVMVVNYITDNGGGGANIFDPNLSNPTSQCGLAGVTPPQASGARYVLVG
jgi:Flp pilus assembly protein TadG